MLYGIIIIFFVIPFSQKTNGQYCSIDKKKLYFLYPMARFILIRAGLEENA